MRMNAPLPEPARSCREAIARRFSGVPAGSAPAASGASAETTIDLIVSRTIAHAAHHDDDVDAWIKARRNNPVLHAGVIPLDRVKGWRTEAETGNIRHESGKFYSIIGVHARHRTGTCDLEWDQPIIDQPEIGILGILARKIRGVLHFCLQAKAEPGTLHAVQLSPTVQATYSNYTRAHGGDLPPLVSYFLNPPQERILFSKLQTEDGGRFLFKSNRNLIVLVDEGELLELPGDFIWLTLRQISRLIRTDNLINACCRSVLAGLFSGLPPDIRCQQEENDAEAALPQVFPDPTPNDAMPQVDFANRSWRSYAGLVQWIDDMKAENHMLQKRVPLKALRDWRVDNNGHLSYKSYRYFSIIGLEVNSCSREVGSWCQPIIDNISTGIIGLLVRKGADGPEFLMQAKAEVGNRSTVQIAPTVQFTQENYLDNDKLSKPFLFEEFVNPRKCVRIAETRQSEEGARFFQEEHIHRILMLPDDRRIELPRDFRWLTADEIRFLLSLGEQVNSCARSILACLI